MSTSKTRSIIKRHERATQRTPREESLYIDNPFQNTKEMAEAIDYYDSVNHSLAFMRTFDDIVPGQSARVEGGRDVYEYFRPSEALPKKYSDTIKAIDAIYTSLSIVRNIIDLMSDFATEGIQVVHEVPAVEKFYQEWFRKVNGVDRSERFLSGLYRHGMVVVSELYGKIKAKQIADISIADDVNIDKPKFKKSEIPLKYIFRNPGAFSHTNYHKPNDKPEYIFKMPRYLDNNRMFTSFDTDDVKLDADRTYVAYYKKDDWDPKPKPFLYPIIKHAIMIDKLSLADSAALDGAISKVRVFKLGNSDKDLYPSAATIGKFDEILRSNTMGGTIDIIWNQDIDIIESNTDIHDFLGQEKYAPHLSQVYEGLGIPASFVGVGQGTTNNYISLKILMRRLMSGRERLTQFWDSQFVKVQKAMGFAKPARLEFNNLDLGDEESERTLLIQLLDRNIVSSERVQKILGFDPRMENKRINKEEKQRQRGARPDKAGQFHNGDKEFTLERIALDKGYFAPEHLGINKDEGTEEIVSPMEFRFQEIEKSRQSQNQNTNVDQNRGPGGRPQGSKDKEKRKTPIFQPKTKASVELWVSDAQSKIHTILKDNYLSMASKDSLRQLSTEEAIDFEYLKFGVLSNMEPLTKVSEEEVVARLGLPIESTAIASFNQMIEHINRKLNLEEVRILFKSAYIQSKIQ